MQLRPAQFDTLASMGGRHLNWGAMISFDKAFDDNITFFTLDTSTLDGTDILAPTEDNPLQAWDFYEYTDYSDRLIDFTVEMKLDFPYSVVSSIADFSLNNFDDHFTPLSASPIASYILPKRPIRLLGGFKNTNLPLFVGLTQGMPEINDDSKIVTFTAFDFLTQIYEMPIRETIAMANVRTDEVLANIFAQFGLAPSQYDLGVGRNVIPFLFFERQQQTAGDVIRALMQSEMGWLWLGEDGIIRFRPRLEQPTDPVYIFDDTNIVSAAGLDETGIINKVIINADVRVVQDYQYVVSKDITDTRLAIVPASSTTTLSFELQDPCLTIEEPDFGEHAGVSWFTAALPNGTPVTTDVIYDSYELKTNTIEITIQNDNAFDINIDQMWIYGRPGKKISLEPTVYENMESDSVAKYEVQSIEINNNFIQSIDQARSLALTILDEYAEHNDVIELEVKGNPAIQLADVVYVDYQNYSANYRIIGIKNSIGNSKYTQILKCRRYTPRQWFTLDQSILGGDDV